MRSEYTQRLIERAAREEDFRARLTSDPRAAIAEELGVEVPDGLNVRVLEEQLDELVLVLPARFEPGPVDEEMLGGVAGGGGTQRPSFNCSMLQGCITVSDWWCNE